MTAPGGTQPEAPDPREDRIVSHARALARARAAESRKASGLIKEFVSRAIAAGIPTTRLKARSYDGAARYRTTVEGWYLRRDLSVGVDAEGLFYVLSAPASLVSRFKEVSLTPSDPPMELGRGARDGESMPLPDALEKRLMAGADFP
ncbi:MAG: hypothetical protein JW722_03675 [Demequinaceae bacterium]|nr:hypothetical protein [Demequinaceae bacterium]